MTTALATADQTPQKLDDVMLAMDIVDTLRHRDLVLAKELSGEERKEALVKRLKEIYSAQGIEVPDRILEDGVKALEEQRFIYNPPRDSLGIRLARLYIARDRWLPPLGLVAGAALFVTAGYEFGFERPREAAAERTRIEMTVTLPNELEAARDAALALAGDDAARLRIETSYHDGAAAAAAGDRDAARDAVGELKFLSGVLAEELSLRIVNDPGENSGVFTFNDNAPGARNYYLIVEAIDARGRPQALEITSEETGETKRAHKWGVRVPEGEFNRVAADKQDNAIIEQNVVGRKPMGLLAPVYDIPTAGGAILEW